MFIAADEPPAPIPCQTREAETLRLLCRAAALLRTDAHAALTLLEEAGAPAGLKESSEYWALLSRARLSAGQPPAAALAAAQSALGLCQSFALAHNLAGNAEQKAGNLEDAAAAYRKALVAAPDYQAPRLNIGILALRRKDTAAAITALDDLIRRKPDSPGALLLRGQAHLTAGHLLQAVSDLERVTSKQGDNAAAWLLLGTAHAQSGREAASRAAFCRAKALGSTEAMSRCPTPDETDRLQISH